MILGLLKLRVKGMAKLQQRSKGQHTQGKDCCEGSFNHCLSSTPQHCRFPGSVRKKKETLLKTWKGGKWRSLNLKALCDTSWGPRKAQTIRLWKHKRCEEGQFVLAHGQERKGSSKPGIINMALKKTMVEATQKSKKHMLRVYTCTM